MRYWFQLWDEATASLTIPLVASLVLVQAMVRAWERQYPGRTDNLLRAMGHVVPSHLMDPKLHPFTTLRATGVADPAGDKAFDADDECASPQAAQTVKFDFG